MVDDIDSGEAVIRTGNYSNILKYLDDAMAFSIDRAMTQQSMISLVNLDNESRSTYNRCHNDQITTPSTINEGSYPCEEIGKGEGTVTENRTSNADVESHALHDECLRSVCTMFHQYDSALEQSYY